LGAKKKRKKFKSPAFCIEEKRGKKKKTTRREKKEEKKKREWCTIGGRTRTKGEEKKGRGKAIILYIVNKKKKKKKKGPQKDPIRPSKGKEEEWNLFSSWSLGVGGKEKETYRGKVTKSEACSKGKEGKGGCTFRWLRVRLKSRKKKGKKERIPVLHEVEKGKKVANCKHLAGKVNEERKEKVGGNRSSQIRKH